jgi:hypothetical protein
LPLHFQGVNFVFYADDTNILIVEKEEEALEHKVTVVMRQLESWFEKNDLIVNIENTCAISFHPHQNNYPTRPHITFKNNEITYRSEIKFLVLHITENLTWQAQFYSLCANLSKTYYMVKFHFIYFHVRVIYNSHHKGP